MRFLFTFLFFILISMLFVPIAYAQEAGGEVVWFSWVSIGAGFIVLVFEFILGKTKLIKPNSTLEMIFLIIVKLGKGIVEALKPDNNEETKTEKKNE